MVRAQCERRHSTRNRAQVGVQGTQPYECKESLSHEKSSGAYERSSGAQEQSSGAHEKSSGAHGAAHFASEVIAHAFNWLTQHSGSTHVPKSRPIFAQLSETCVAD